MFLPSPGDGLGAGSAGAFGNWQVEKQESVMPCPWCPWCVLKSLLSSLWFFLLLLSFFCSLTAYSLSPPHKHTGFPSFGMDISTACKKDNRFSCTWENILTDIRTSDSLEQLCCSSCHSLWYQLGWGGHPKPLSCDRCMNFPEGPLPCPTPTSSFCRSLITSLGLRLFSTSGHFRLEGGAQYDQPWSGSGHSLW